MKVFPVWPNQFDNFKVGDKVTIKNTETVGIVTATICTTFSPLGTPPHYLVKLLLQGETKTYHENELSLLPQLQD